jgi:transposase
LLARDMIPEAHRATARQREHRTLVRQRQDLQGRITAVMCKLRRILSDVNADRTDLFTADGLAHLAALPLCVSARFVADQLLAEFHALRRQLKELTARLKAFAEAASTDEAEARAVLRTIPGVGPVTVDVVVSELGAIDRFGSAKKVCAYAGLVPAVRESGGRKSRELPITEQGSGLLRWALVEASWRLVRQGRRWRSVYDGLKRRHGSKKAIVAVARRLLGGVVSMLRTMSPYRLAAA